MDYCPLNQSKGTKKEVVYSNWIDYSPRTMNPPAAAAAVSCLTNPRTTGTVVPPPPPSMMQFDGSMNSRKIVMSTLKYPPLASPHFMAGIKDGRIEQRIQQQPGMKGGPKVAMISPPSIKITKRKGQKKKKKSKSRVHPNVNLNAPSVSGVVVPATRSDTIPLQPLANYVCQIKPSRRKGTKYAEHGDFPPHLCSAPYKYLMRITHPLNDGLNETDFQVYLTAYDREHQEKGQLQGGLELEYLRSTVNDSDQQVHFYHVQFTLTSFLNQNEKYRLNCIIHQNNNEESDSEEEEDEKTILQSPEFLLVARKNKRMDDLFWNRYSTSTSKSSIKQNNNVRRKRNRRKKKSSSSLLQVSSSQQLQRKTRTSRKSKKKMQQKKTNVNHDQKKDDENNKTGKKRKRMNQVRDDEDEDEDEDNFTIDELQKPSKKRKLD